ncbi:MAG TPA: FkbM family methyltransferase [Trebonia sp.]|nr:FkbM family methyltransferase [Trebonia sp.]
MPSRYTEARNALANSAAIFATPRNVARYLGYVAMRTTVEVVWRSRVRSGDLTAALTDHFAGDGTTVVDIGASWGLFSYHLARLVGGGGTVFSYEPHPMDRPVLEKLVKARPNVRFRPAAVSDLTGSADLQVPVFGSRHVTAQSSLAHGFDGQRGVRVEKVTVPTVRLDDEVGGKRVDFVKIDVEGHEMSVLRGASDTLRQYLPPMLIEIEQRHLDCPIKDVFAQIDDIGYVLYFIDGAALRPIEEFDLEKHQLASLVRQVFTPFSMPEGYVHNFFAVASPDILAGAPGFTA